MKEKINAKGRGKVSFAGECFGVTESSFKLME